MIELEGNTSDLYLEGTQFKSQAGHWLSWWISWFFPVLPSQLHDSIWL